MPSTYRYQSGGFNLGPEQNIFDAGNGDRAAAELLRDNYGLSNPSWLSDYENDESLNIILYYFDSINSRYIAQYQVKKNNVWRDNSSQKAIRGAAGSETDFSAVPQNHIVAIGDNSEPIDSGFFIGPDGKTLTTDGSIQTGPGSVKIGPMFTLSSGMQAIMLTLGDGSKALGLNVEYDSSGTTHPYYYKLSPETQLNINTTNSVVLPEPFELAYTTVGDNLTVNFDVIPAESGILKVEFFEGADDTGDLIFSETLNVNSSDINTILSFDVGNPYIISAGTQIFVRFSGIALKGGIGGPGDYLEGQNTIYFVSYVNGYEKTNFLTTDSNTTELKNNSNVIGSSATDALNTLNTISNPYNSETFTANVSTTDNTWTTIHQMAIDINTYGTFNFDVIAKRTDDDGLFRRNRAGMYQYENGSLSEDADTVYSLSISSSLSIRETISGNNINIQVRGSNGQDWDWTINGTKSII